MAAQQHDVSRLGIGEYPAPDKIGIGILQAPDRVSTSITRVPSDICLCDFISPSSDLFSSR